VCFLFFVCFLFALVWFFLWLTEEVLTLLFLLHHENGDFSVLMKDIFSGNAVAVGIGTDKPDALCDQVFIKETVSRTRAGSGTAV
jgi:hypothetical protein